MPSTKSLAVIVVFLVVITAVLVGLLSGGTEPPSQQPEPSVGAPLSDYTEADLPRGVDRDGFLAGVTADAYQATLRQSSYTVTTSKTVEAANRTTVQTTVYKTSSQGTTRVKRVNGTVTLRQYFAPDEDRVYTERHTATGVTYDSSQNRPLRSPSEAATRAILRAGAFDPTTAVSTADGVAVTLTADTLDQPAVAESQFTVDTLNSIRGTATVNSTQIVSSLNTTLAGVSNNTGDIRIQYAAETTAVNGTVVAEPLWVADARENSYETTHGTTAGGRALVVSLENGPTLSAGATVVLSVDQGETFTQYSQTLSQPVQTGDTLYLSRTADGLHVSSNQAPQQLGTELDATVHYVEILPDGREDAVIELSVVP